MKRRVSFLLALLMLVSLLGVEWIKADAIIPGEDAAPTGEKIYCNATLDDDFAPDRVLVVLTNAASTSLKTYSLADFTGYGFKSVSNLTSATTALANAKIQGKPIPEEFATNANVITFEDFYDVDLEKFNQILCLELNTPGKQNVLNAIKVLEKHPDVKYAGPDYYMSLFSGETNDTYVDEQWALNMIDLPEAWEIASDRTVKVGVIDSAVDIGHPDISGSMYYHSEIDHRNRFNSMVDGSPLDTSTVVDGHGTMVAGIIAATANNSVGIAGACNNVKLVSIRIANTDSDATVSSIARAIERAQLEYIQILNLSYGISVSPTNNSEVNEEIDAYSSLYEAIENYSGLMVCAAGNSAANIDYPDASGQYVVPAIYNLPNLITVAASTKEDEIWSDISGIWGSNYGMNTVDLFAPGAGIISCYLRSSCSNLCDSSIHLGYGYHQASGTSFAAPYVTAVAAMIMAKYPTHSVEQIVERIRLGVDRVYCNTEDVYADYCTWGGRLNAYKALHDHAYAASIYSSYQHKLTCVCGVVKYATHNWENVVVVLPGGQTMLGTRCSTCGYQPD